MAVNILPLDFFGNSDPEQDKRDLEWNNLAYNTTRGNVIHVGYIEGRVSNVNRQEKASHTDAYTSFSIGENHIIFYQEFLPDWLVDGIEVSVHVGKNGVVQLTHCVSEEELKCRRENWWKAQGLQERPQEIISQTPKKP